MPTRSGNPDGLIVLPAALAGLRDKGLRRWLAKARWQRGEDREEPLRPALAALGAPPPPDGLAALRWWGQTGQPPAGWVCAADPVHLQARLDHLCLFELPDLAETELDLLLTDLRARLSAERGPLFTRVAGLTYLENPQGMATARVSATVVNGMPPDAFLPQGPHAATHDRLQSELQMCLHDAGINRTREEAGRPPVNALWLWGGGIAESPEVGVLPTLYADDPLFLGYWSAAGGTAAPWPGSLRACTDARPFVAVVPGLGDPQSRQETALREARDLGRRGRFGRLAMLFRDGFMADVRRADRWLFWRAGGSLPDAATAR